MTKKSITFSLLTMFLCCCADQPGSGQDVSQLLGAAVRTLGAQKGSPNLCVLTDAAYVKLAGRTTEAYVDLIVKETGCSVGKGNLLFFHRPASHPLIIAVFSKDTAECIVIKFDGRKGNTVKLQMRREDISEQDFWQEASAGLDSSDLFSVVSILGAWSVGAPYDLLRCADIHGHFCPGLVFGYFIAETIDNKYALREGEEYVFIANPDFCGNDAISMVLDLTPGKKNLVVKGLTHTPNKDWSLDKGAGILVRWHDWKDKGHGVILGIDMANMRERTGFTRPQGQPRTIAPAVLDLIPHLDRGHEFVTVVSEFPVDSKLMEQLTTAAEDPYGIIGLAPKP
jgi:formylmethanofuran dehydrogenase subunit E-like metal-binding protein